MKRFLPALLMLLLAPAGARALTLERSGTSAGVELAQPGSSRGLAMGGAGTAAACGAEALDWNPARVARYPWFNASLAVRRQWGDTDASYLAAACPLVWGVPSASLVLNTTRNIEGYDAGGLATGTFSTKSLALRLGYAAVWGPVAAGAAVEAIGQDLGTARVDGLAADAGVDVELYPGLHAAAACLRWGKTGGGDPYSTEVRAGFSAQALPNLLLTYDLVCPRDNEMYLAAGGEWKPWAALAFRAGWRNGPVSTVNLGWASSLTAGAGWQWGDWRLDYAFQPFGALGTAHQLSLNYAYTAPAAAPAATASPTPAPAPAGPRFDQQQIQPREYEGRVVFEPKPPQGFQVKEIRFKIQDREGKVIRTFRYAGNAAPRQLVWDGRDDQGKKLHNEKFNFAFEYVTDRGVKTHVQEWPAPAPARKLQFAEKGEGVEPEVAFGFEGRREGIQQWTLDILDGDGKTVQTLGQSGSLPATVVWDGRDARGAWADPRQAYSCRLQLTGQDGARATIEKPVIPIPAKMLSPRPNRTRFKITQIWFDFNDTQIPTTMADKVQKAAEIHAAYGGRAHIEIQGHADEVGSRAVNHEISQRRGAAVEELMRRLGSPRAGNLVVKGFGKDAPLAAGRDERSRQINRRVEIVFDVPEK